MKRGLNWMWVWDDSDYPPKKRVVICTDLGGGYPILAIAGGCEDAYQEGDDDYGTSAWKHCKPICECEVAHYGAHCSLCGKFKELTPEMEAIIEKYGTEKKWGRPHWHQDLYGVFTGRFRIDDAWVLAIMRDEHGDFSVDVAEVQHLREYREPKTVPMEYDDYLRNNITCVVRRGDERRVLIIDMDGDGCVVGAEWARYSFENMSSYFTQTNGKPLTKVV